MSKKEGRDQELDQLLGILQTVKPDDLQMQKWKISVKKEAAPRLQWKWAAQLVAAVFVGFIVGALFFKNPAPAFQPVEIAANVSTDGATFEHSHANLD